MLPDYQLRVIIEKAELDLKRIKLAVVIAESKAPDGMELIPHEEMLRLIRQNSVMAQYSEVLGDRIHNFEEKL